MTNLVVCCDGTWNTPDMRDNDLPSPTNVVKLRNALVNDGNRQKVYYHPGVGTGKGLWDKVTGGGLGDGLDRNIKSGYFWLASHYSPGDRICIFGFSRGAYTARSLGGMIAKCGLLDLTSGAIAPAEAWERVDAVFEGYRSEDAFAAPPGMDFFAPEPGFNGPPIHFIGVWDTVGALGVPQEFALLGLLTNPAKYMFHNTKLSPLVRHARHAVAIDERRATFAPTLWSGAHPDLKQVWFPGCHGDVGGGHAGSELSDGALKWMVDEAADKGLLFRTGVADQFRDRALGVIHESDIGFYKYLKTLPRSVPFITETQADYLHASTNARCSTPSLSQGCYWESGKLAVGETAHCTIYAAEHWNCTNLYLEAGRQYALAATGEWIDMDDKFSPAGKGERGFQLGDAGRFLGSMLGEAETLFARMADRRGVDFLWTKRLEAAPWFALIGFCASEHGWTDTQLATGETFLIGEGTLFTPTHSGYLYGFANDAWQTYGNNHGSVTLSVTRQS